MQARQARTIDFRVECRRREKRLGGLLWHLSQGILYFLNLRHAFSYIMKAVLTEKSESCISDCISDATTIIISV